MREARDSVDELGKMLGSPVFWAGTVVAGLLVNFASQWLYSRMAAVPGKLGDWRRQRSQQRLAAFEKDQALLSENPELIPLYIAAQMHLNFIAIMLAVLSCLVFVGAATLRPTKLFTPDVVETIQVIFVFGAAVLIIFATRVFDRATERASVCRAVFRRAAAAAQKPVVEQSQAP